MASVAKFNNWFGVDVQLNTEVGTGAAHGNGSTVCQPLFRSYPTLRPNCLTAAPMPYPQHRRCVRPPLLQNPYHCHHAPNHPMPCLQVVSIDRAARRVTTRDATSGAETQLEYDALVLSPGAAAIRPPLPGIDLPGIFKCKEIPDV